MNLGFYEILKEKYQFFKKNMGIVNEVMNKRKMYENFCIENINNKYDLLVNNGIIKKKIFPSNRYKSCMVIKHVDKLENLI